MAAASLIDALKLYAKRFREQRRANAAIGEPGLAPEFKTLVEDLLPHLPAAPALTVTAEYVRAGVGRPDLALAKANQPARAFVELKSTDKSTDGKRWKIPHDKRQFERFSEFANWMTSNFHEVRLYARGESQGAATLLPEEALDPAKSDGAADKLIDAHDSSAALKLIERLAQADVETPKDAKALATHLAHAARLVCGIVKDRLAELNEAGTTGAPIQEVRKEFRDVLYSHPEAGGYSSDDFDSLFAGAFAQTLAFGLLLVRESDGSKKVDYDAAAHMPPEHPLMKTTLRVLSESTVRDEVGTGFDVMLDTVNSFDMDVLRPKASGHDPVLHLYEDFLETFDPVARERFGVFYTPVEVVRFMVGALDRALKDLGTDGIADESVHILDPATGTGTFLIGVADRLRREAAKHGVGQVEKALQGLAKRMYGFELLIGPYAVAHYRLHHALTRTDDPAVKSSMTLPRLGVYLADTLARPQDVKGMTSTFGLFGAGIADERKAAEDVRSKQPVLAILGNPPYRRLETGENETLVGRWMDETWDDLKAPVRDAGQGGQLNTFPELSVAFWRWAMWKLFESPDAPKRGVVAFITNRKFLTGWPYAGLRKMLRERFDRIEVIDLRGDSRRGERAGVEGDENVFNIQVGVCITLAVATGEKPAGALAEVRYNDAWAADLTSRRAKKDWLASGEGAGDLAGAVEVDRGALDDMRPLPFYNGDLISLAECFVERSSGLESKRDHVVYGFSPGHLKTQLEAIYKASDEKRDELFNSTAGRPAATAQAEPLDKKRVRAAAYRPLDRRSHYDHPAWNDRPRPLLSDVWGAANVCLFTLPSGTGQGPGAWAHGLYPDRHAFRGSYGGYAFPLWDRRAGPGATNLKPELLDALELAYGKRPEPQAVFDAILCLLSARSYTTRFAEDLEDVFPHVPFPADRALFDEAAALGAEIRGVETFARKPAAKYADLAKVVSAAPDVLGAVARDGAGFSLGLAGAGRVEPVPQAVWDFSVSGYFVLRRWLAAREGQPIDAAFIPEMRDVVARIAELIDLFDAADSLLDCTLADPLSRAALGTLPSESVPADE